MTVESKVSALAERGYRMEDRRMKHAAAHKHISAIDPRIAELIARSRRYDVTPSLLVRPFDALAESIAYQQLSGKAAATIWGRVRALYPRRKFLDPKMVLKKIG